VVSSQIYQVDMAADAEHHLQAGAWLARRWCAVI
jgi:hypothetical protein